jgi:hypothetical protein
MHNVLHPNLVGASHMLLYSWLSLGALMLCLIALPASLAALISRRLRRRAGWAAIASTIGIVASFVSFGYTHDLQKPDVRLGEKAKQVTQNETAAHPELSDEAKRNISNHKITLGMTPEEARLAGGGCFYKVKADPRQWPPGSDPLVVMARQTDHPDDSEITLTFRNTTQFDTREPTTFRVELRRGRVTEIVAVTSPLAANSPRI